MSILQTLSVFYYGFNVTKENQGISFDEGAGEIVAYIPIGDYTATEFAEIFATTMTLAGTLVYTSSFNRTTRIITLSSTANFTLKTQTGSLSGVSAFPLAGFTTPDKTGASSYVASNPAGFEYIPQMVLGEYIEPDDYEVKESAAVNLSTSGEVQTVQFGDGQRMRCNVRGISDEPNDNRALFYENATGIADARAFMRFLITKGKVEFMPNKDSRATYYDLILESTESNRQGVGYTLNHMRGAIRFFETGTLLFRKVIES